MLEEHLVLTVERHPLTIKRCLVEMGKMVVLVAEVAELP
nr:MAG TPA: hypothetical protein [Caudoviricetes sp.]